MRGDRDELLTRGPLEHALHAPDPLIHEFSRPARFDHLLSDRFQGQRAELRRWRAAVVVPAQGEETASNLPVPAIRWNLFTKWAKEMDALFGDDAEIVAVPVGPSDYRKDKKISRVVYYYELLNGLLIAERKYPQLFLLENSSNYSLLIC